MAYVPSDQEDTVVFRREFTTVRFYAENVSVVLERP